MSGLRHRAIALAATIGVSVAAVGRAQPGTTPAPGATAATSPTPPSVAARPTVAVARLEPLGLEAERAARLEALFRIEVERLVGAPLPTLVQVDRELAADVRLRGCTAAVGCLADLGARLGVTQMVGGNVGELGTSYVIDVKLVDVATQAELRRVSTPLAGTPDDLIEAVRVAAHQLLAPETVRGELQVLADLPGATVRIDGRAVGTTPLARPVAGLTLGAHEVIVEKPGSRVVKTQVDVRFQKTTQVVVGLIELVPTPVRSTARPEDQGTPAWRWVALGAAGVVLGVAIGLAFRSSSDSVSCAEDPDGCLPR